MVNSKSVGYKIARARKDKNMSQAQLAQLLFISPQAVGKWERGESIPDIVTMNHLAEILGRDLNYFSENFQTLSDAQGVKAGHSEGDEQDKEPQAAGMAERRLLTTFNGSDLSKSDFAGITALKRKFSGSALQGANFTGANLSGSSFSGCDMREARFDCANLTDCSFSASELAEANFEKTILIRTTFTASGLAASQFLNAELVNARLAKTDLRQTIFTHCIFNGVDFRYADLRKVNLGGQTFIDVKFDKAALNETSFRGSIFRNVSFRPSYALTNKYHRAIATICFDGAVMDKLTFAELKSMGADLAKVTKT